MNGLFPVRPPATPFPLAALRRADAESISTPARRRDGRRRRRREPALCLGRGDRPHRSQPQGGGMAARAWRPRARPGRRRGSGAQRREPPDHRGCSCRPRSSPGPTAISSTNPSSPGSPIFSTAPGGCRRRDRCRVVINISFGYTAGPHDGSGLLERFMELVVQLRPNTRFVLPAGNEHLSRCHAEIDLARARTRWCWTGWCSRTTGPTAWSRSGCRARSCPASTASR